MLFSKDFLINVGRSFLWPNGSPIISIQYIQFTLYFQHLQFLFEIEELFYPKERGNPYSLFYHHYVYQQFV